MKGEPPTDNLTLYDHWLALHREIEKPLTISVQRKPNAALDTFNDQSLESNTDQPK
jgi:hypothetical protein